MQRAADLKELHVDFLKHDADKSGELDFDEFVVLFKDRIPMDEEGYKKLFSQMDADGGGTVSFQELATSLSVIGKGTAGASPPTRPTLLTRSPIDAPFLTLLPPARGQAVVRV